MANIKLRFKHMLCALMLLGGTSTLSAKDVTVKTDEGISVTYALNSTDMVARVKGYAATTKTKITIPSKINVSGKSYTVAKIGASAFSASDFKTINLPNTITLIDNDAFRESDVTNINIPTKVEKIGDRAFQGTSIKTAHIPSTCTQIGDYAFNAIKLASVTFDEGFAKLSIGECAFMTTAITAIKLPYRVNNIGPGAFLRSDLETINWPENVSEISERCFYLCSCLKSIKIPFGVTSIGQQAFENCRNLITVEFPSSLKDIKRWAFFLTGIESLKIPEGVSVLGPEAFESCGSLKSVSLPSTLTKIEKCCFQGCDALNLVECAAPVPPECGVSVFANGVPRKAKLVVPEAVWRDYASADTWCLFNYEGYPDAGIDTVVADEDQSTPEYFNMSGVRIDAPRRGEPCIVRRSGKAKVIITNQ